jgi:hypothetical protein
MSMLSLMSSSLMMAVFLESSISVGEAVKVSPDSMVWTFQQPILWTFGFGPYEVGFLRVLFQGARLAICFPLDKLESSCTQ